MTHFVRRMDSAFSDMDCSTQNGGPAGAISPISGLEDQLAQVIRSARDVAASAEEMLRELALFQQAARTGRGAITPVPFDEALLPLQANRERLMSAMRQLGPN